MSAMAETAQAIHVGSLAELPTEQVRRLHSYAHRMFCTTYGHEENYYRRMLDLTAAELQQRSDQLAKNWQDSYAQ